MNRIKINPLSKPVCVHCDAGSPLCGGPRKHIDGSSCRPFTVHSAATRTAVQHQPSPLVGGARGERRAVPGRLAPLSAFTSTLPDKDPSEVRAPLSLVWVDVNGAAARRAAALAQCLIEPSLN